MQMKYRMDNKMYFSFVVISSFPLPKQQSNCRVVRVSSSKSKKALMHRINTVEAETLVSVYVNRIFTIKVNT